MFALEASSTFSPPFWMSIQMAATVTVLSRPPSPCCFGALHVCVGGLNLLATSLGFYIDGSHGDRQLVTLQVDLYIGGCRMRLLEWSLCLNIGITMTPFTCTFYLCNLTGPRHQVIHQRCPDHDYVDVPGLGRRSMTIMFRTGLFPHDRSRFMTQIPKPKALWTCLKNLMVEALQKPGLRLPTLGEVKKQTQLREDREEVNQHSKLGPRGDARSAPSSKRRRVRIRGKTNEHFV